MRTSLYTIPAALMCFGGLGGKALAAEGGAKLILNLPAFSYTSADTKQKPKGGSTVNSTTTGMQTQDLSRSYAEIIAGSYAVYFYPFSDAKTISLSYFPTDMVEVGLDLGINNTKLNKPKKYEGSSNTIGVFGKARPSFGGIGTELGLVYDSINEKNDARVDESGAEVRPGHITTNIFRLSADVMLPLTNNFTYLGGLWYQIQNSDDKEGKVKTTAGRLGVNIATLRLALD